MAFAPRKWQQECFSRFQQHLREGQTSFVIEACMGAGKSAIAARIAKHLLEMKNPVDHVLVLVPWKSIQGDNEKGMQGAFGKLFGLDVRNRFFTFARRQVHQPIPALDATITLYQEVCNPAAIQTLELWKSKGFRFALICDEIHHTNEINGTWGEFVSKMKSLADFSVFMSGTFFRSDKDPIACIPLDGDRPIRHYAYTYPMGVSENVVRSVTSRHIDATVALYNSDRDERYEKELSELSGKELAEGKKQVLDPHGEWVRQMIQTVHEDLMATRLKYPDAACLFVCRPGRDTNFTRDGDEAIEDKHVHLIAKQIRDLTGLSPTVVTHHDQDSVGKISRFRKAKDPYLVAVNMVSEGCDIPRIRAVAFCRSTTSEMLFRQIVGRALRIQYDEATGQPLEDNTAAQIYIPTFRELVEFAERLWAEAQEGVKTRREKPPCETCGKQPCECEPKLFPDPQTIWGLEHTPTLAGGRMAFQDVQEIYVQAATQIIAQRPEHQHQNRVQVAAILQAYDQNRSLAQGLPVSNPGEERDRLRRKINRTINRLAHDVYDKKFALAYFEEIEKPFGAKFKEIINNWTVDRLREVYERLERRIMKGYRNG